MEYDEAVESFADVEEDVKKLAEAFVERLTTERVDAIVFPYRGGPPWLAAAGGFPIVSGIEYPIVVRKQS